MLYYADDEDEFRQQHEHRWSSVLSITPNTLGFAPKQRHIKTPRQNELKPLSSIFLLLCQIPFSDDGEL